MKKSRRSQLLQHIAEITSIAIANKEYTGINTDAFTISLDLNLDRANVSRMLNDLWRENILIKIQGRPTFYPVSYTHLRLITAIKLLIAFHYLPFFVYCAVLC